MTLGDELIKIVMDRGLLGLLGGILAYTTAKWLESQKARQAVAMETAKLRATAFVECFSPLFTIETKLIASIVEGTMRGRGETPALEAARSAVNEFGSEVEAIWELVARTDSFWALPCMRRLAT